MGRCRKVVKFRLLIIFEKIIIYYSRGTYAFFLLNPHREKIRCLVAVLGIITSLKAIKKHDWYLELYTNIFQS